MNLCASLVVRNELGRYLEPCIEHLLEFCDTVVVLDDASDDGTSEWLASHSHIAGRLRVHRSFASSFFVHEGRTRQTLLVDTLAQNPTHVLNLDADEFVSDGAALRARIGSEPDVAIWSLEIEEVWRADDALHVREDGGWRSHPLPILWRVDPSVRYAIMDRKLACRRVPTVIFRAAGRAVASGVELLHLGWADEAERAGRFARYAEHDGGRFHAGAHLDSIMWPDARVTLRERPWPQGAVFDSLRERFTETWSVIDENGERGRLIDVS